MAPRPFQEFLAHGLACPGQGWTYATPADWQRHLRTLVPWARLHQGVEIRACESQAPAMALALVALIKGLCTRVTSLQAVEELVGAYDQERLAHLMHQATLYGLDADVDGLAFRDMLSLLLDIAWAGLEEHGAQEEVWLTPCMSLVDGTRDMAPQHRAAGHRVPSLHAHLLSPLALQADVVSQRVWV